MDKAVLDVLTEYEARAEREFAEMAKLTWEQIGSRIDEFLIFVGPETGRLMHMLAVAAEARVLVEVGASYGYSTVWLADAARATGGTLHSLELSAAKVRRSEGELGLLCDNPVLDAGPSTTLHDGVAAAA